MKVTSGYSGGKTENPTYDIVLSKTSGHAESIQIIYDSEVIAFEDLLEVFFETHDPTTLNRQGNDIGPQYRSAIFYHNQEQKQKAEAYIKFLNEKKVFKNPIVTEVSAFKKFYSAEEYHQNYFRENPSQPYCYFVIRPKLEKFRKEFKEKLKSYKQ